MKRRLIELELLEKGDKILLPGGEAIVIEDEIIKDLDDRFYGEIEIKWMVNCTGKKGKDTVSRKYCSLIKA